MGFVLAQEVNEIIGILGQVTVFDKRQNLMVQLVRLIQVIHIAANPRTTREPFKCETATQRPDQDEATPQLQPRDKWTSSRVLHDYYSVRFQLKNVSSPSAAEDPND
jgi:hypothetical protein